MTTERELTELFHERAGQAPVPGTLLDGAMYKLRVRRQRIITGVSAFAIVALSATGIGGTVASQAADSSTLFSASCIYPYSARAVAENTEFAFDGTVLDVGEPISRHSSEGAAWRYVGVTFEVNEWFKGFSGTSITVDLVASGTTSVGDEPLNYKRGTRLLVSGRADSLAPIAWYGCGGFTRNYDQGVAQTWRKATR